MAIKTPSRSHKQEFTAQGKTLSIGDPTTLDGAFRQTAGEVAFSISSSAATVASSGTIDTSVAVARVTNAGAITGVIMEAGVYDGQVVTVVNESANSVTMAAAGTSNVADGTSCVIAALTAMRFVWSATPARWYKC